MVHRRASAPPTAAKPFGPARVRSGTMPATSEKASLPPAVPREGAAAVRGVRIVTPIPGPNAKKIVAGDDRYLMKSTKTSPVAAASASGVWVTDVDGNRLLDFTSGVGVV